METTNDQSTNDLYVPGNLLLDIWTKPTLTLKYILANCPDKYLIPLYILGGIHSSIDRAISKDSGNTMDPWLIITLAIIFGGGLGWISYYIYAYFLSLTGRWIDGKAEPREFRTVLCWSSIPSICSLILFIPQFIIYGEDLFRSEWSNTEWWYLISFIGFGLLELTLGIWSLVIFIKGIMILQGFGVGKSLLNAFIPVFLLIGVVLVIVLIIVLLTQI